jgi:hypothetical protein
MTRKPNPIPMIPMLTIQSRLKPFAKPFLLIAETAVEINNCAELNEQVSAIYFKPWKKLNPKIT